MPPARCLAFAASLVALTCLAVPAAFAEPFAVLASARGAVEVAPASGPRARAAFGRALERGDRVIVGAGGSATIFFQDGNVVELGERSALTVGGARPAAKAKGAEMPAEVYAGVSRFVTEGSRENGLVAVSQLRSVSDAPLLLAPRNTSILDVRPTFRWRPVEGATRYRVLLSSAEGTGWEREVTADSSLAYPADADPLAPGSSCSWSVVAEREDSEIRREEAVLHVVDDAEAGRVRSALAGIARGAAADSAAARFLSGSYLSGRGLYLDALAEFRALDRLSPDSPAPHEAMGHLYRAEGLMDLAAAEYQRALSFGR